MNNKNLFYTIAIYAFVIAFIIASVYSILFYRTAPGGWAAFFRALLLVWLVAGGVGYAMAKLLMTKMNIEYVEEVPAQVTQPSVQYYYNNYCNGFCRVEKITIAGDGTITSEFNFLDKKGEYISEKWYAAVSDFYEEGIALVTDGEMFNVINTEGKLISNMWFYGIEVFNEGLAKVKWNDNKVNFIDTEGNLLWKEWRPEIELNRDADDSDNNE